MSRTERSDFRKVVAFCLVSSICLSRGVYLVYLSKAGLSFVEVAAYQAIFSGCLAGMEIPTGVVGD